MRHILSFKIFENVGEEIHYYKEFPEVDPLTDLLLANGIFDNEDLTALDIKMINNYFEKLGYSYHRTISFAPHYLDILVNESDDYVGCHIEIKKHVEDWYIVLFYRKKRTPFGERSYTQKLEFNRWLCDGIPGVFKLLKKLADEYTFLTDSLIKEDFNLEQINPFAEIDMEDDSTAEYVENTLKLEEYDILDSDVKSILNINNKLGLDFKHDIKIHAGRGGKEKRVLLLWYNYSNVKFNVAFMMNIRRISEDYFYIFTDARGKYNDITNKEKKYFLCDGIIGLVKFFKHIKNDYLTI
jgi:hypothetical protein